MEAGHISLTEVACLGDIVGEVHLAVQGEIHLGGGPAEAVAVVLGFQIGDLIAGKAVITFFLAADGADGVIDPSTGFGAGGGFMEARDSFVAPTDSFQHVHLGAVVRHLVEFAAQQPEGGPGTFVIGDDGGHFQVAVLVAEGTVGGDRGVGGVGSFSPLVLPPGAEEQVAVGDLYVFFIR